ncbi:MAG: acyl-CoA thioesterase [Pseudohongiellaceae bacterium]
MTEENNEATEPKGELAMQTIAMPKDTNANGDIFGGWLVSQMDLAAGIMSKRVAQGRSVTVAIKEVNFLLPVTVGSTVTCYASVVRTGRTSMHIAVEVWISAFALHEDLRKAAEGLFVFVAIDDEGKPRPIPTS